jgi:prevent-host-death family protein
VKAIKLTDAKNNLSRYVDRVRQGERLRILVRGVPAADLVPVADWDEGPDTDRRLADLERRGLLRRGTGHLPEALLEPGPPAGGRAASKELVEERRGGR